MRLVLDTNVVVSGLIWHASSGGCARGSGWSASD